MGVSIEERGAARKVTAVAARPVVRAEEFVQQVPVAVLDVDEVESGFGCEDRRVDVRAREFVEFVVGEELRVARVDACVEERVPVRDTGLGISEGARPPAGVGELQSRDLLGGQQGAERGEIVDG